MAEDERSEGRPQVSGWGHAWRSPRDVWGYSVPPRQPGQRLTYLFRSQMISGLGLPSALHVKNTVFPKVTSASWGSDVIRGLSVPRRKWRSLGLNHPVKANKNPNQIPHVPEKIPSEPSIPATNAPTRRTDGFSAEMR